MHRRYFASPETLPTDGGSSATTTARATPVRTATILALTKSFGTLCFSSLVLAVCTGLRALARRATRRSENLVVALVACCLRCLLDLVESLNKFAVCMHAITGEDLCASGRLVTTLLRRHGLSAWFVDRLTSFVLVMTALAFAALAGASTYSLVYLTNPATPANTRRAVAGAFGTIAALLAYLVLSFCASFLTQVVDASYTCLALDLDAGAPHQPPLRDVMIPIVKPGYAVSPPHPADDAAVPVGVPARADVVGPGLTSVFPGPGGYAPTHPTAELPLKDPVAGASPKP